MSILCRRLSTSTGVSVRLAWIPRSALTLTDVKVHSKTNALLVCPTYSASAPLDSENNPHKLLLWVHTKASQGERFIHNFAETSVDKNQQSSVKYYTSYVLRRLLSSITFEEKMLRKMPPASVMDSVEVLFPDSTMEEIVEQDFKHLVDSKLDYHRRWMGMNALILPITLAAGVLPGPNIFFFWNVFRLYSHYQAFNSAKILTTKQHEGNIKFSASNDLSLLLKESSSINSIEDFLTRIGHNKS